MKPFGLTGNIGCGKSTVAAILATFPDTIVIDCDQIAKEVILDPDYTQEIAEVLGVDITSNGSVDPKKIAEIIFGQPDKKRALEALIHPLVWKTLEKRMRLIDPNKIVVVESAIIFETGSEHRFAAVIAAICNTTEQFRRLRENRNMTDAEIQARLEQQFSWGAKARQSKFVIRTDCSMGELKERAADLYWKLKKERSVS